MTAMPRPPTPAVPGRAADHALLAQAVREAGALAQRFFGNAPRQWEKSADNPVSEADIAVNDLLHRTLGAARPDYGWLSEESTDDPRRLDAPRTWVVDPIDGTQPFLEGVPEFAVAAALTEAGRPIAACVFNPATAEFFEAAAGAGAKLNGQPIRVGACAAIPDARLLITEHNVKRAQDPALFARATLADIGSIAYRLALVACGRYDAVVSLAGKSDWDVAAADLIVAEAGGCMTTVSGDLYRYNRASTRHRSVIAANPVLQAALCAAFRHTV
jgi:myo-inositol-1(or 4)-monophosphatase